MVYEFQSDKTILITIYSSFLVIGICLLIFSYHFLSQTLGFISTGVTAKAKVIEILEVEDADGRAYSPILEFADKSNKILRHTYSPSANLWRTGERISIIYDPEEPSNLKIISYWGLFRWPIILLMMALPLISLAVGYFLFLQKIVH